MGDYGLRHEKEDPFWLFIKRISFSNWLLLYFALECILILDAVFFVFQQKIDDSPSIFFETWKVLLPCQWYMTYTWISPWLTFSLYKLLWDCYSFSAPNKMVVIWGSIESFVVLHLWVGTWFWEKKPLFCKNHFIVGCGRENYSCNKALKLVHWFH